jgi:hypothetical protein
MLVQSWTNIIILVQYYTNIGQLFLATRDRTTLSVDFDAVREHVLYDVVQRRSDSANSSPYTCGVRKADRGGKTATDSLVAELGVDGKLINMGLLLHVCS